MPLVITFNRLDFHFVVMVHAHVSRKEGSGNLPGMIGPGR